MSRSERNRAAIAELAQEIKAAGFRPFIAESGEYGFYTDDKGSALVSFQCDLGGIVFSGNHVSDNPKSNGNGWRMESRGSFAAMLAARTPSWAGGASCHPQTLAGHLRVYQSSSKYREV